MYDSIIILGATATGKTDISIKLAKKLNSEIINVDSMYIYKELNIGTAKPTKEEMNGVKHHLIDFVDANDSYSVSQYRNDAKVILDKMLSNNQVPIIVGGTGFYIDSLINNYSYGDTVKNDEIRNILNQELNDFGKEYLHKKLQDLDPQSADKLHVNDVKRVIRALEIILISGNKKSSIHNLNESILKNPLIIGLNYPREILYERINLRVDKMMDSGLLDEVKNLYYNLKLSPEEHQSMKGIGYKELVDYLNNLISLEDAVDKIKQHSRNYAKRQITWFKRNDRIIWFNCLEEQNIVEKIIDLLKKEG